MLTEGAVPMPGATRELVTLEVDWGDASTFGEACPVAGFSRESAWDVVRALEGVGRVTCDPAGRVDPSVARLPSLGFALELAARTRAAVLRGVSLAALLAEPASPGDVEVSALARGVEPPDVSTSGPGPYPAVKVKLGRGPVDHEALRALHRLGAPLRFDANGAWTRLEAPARMAELAPYAPELVEQPCPVGELVGLEAPLSWAADESLVDEREATALLADPRCSTFVLKPSLLGLERALSLGRLAARAGKRLVVTHAFGGPLELAAARAVAHALATSSALLACGVGPHEGLARSPLRVALAPIDGGRLRAPDVAGVGAVSWS